MECVVLALRGGLGGSGVVEDAMRRDEAAAILNGREIGSEITDSEAKAWAESGLVVIFGASDDLCELRGAIHDEVGVYDGGEFCIDPDGKTILQPIEDDDREVLEKHFVMDAVKKRRAKSIRIDAYWCPKELDCSWAYKSSVPASTFDIMEDGELYCRGIVIDLMESRQ